MIVPDGQKIDEPSRTKIEQTRESATSGAVSGEGGQTAAIR